MSRGLRSSRTLMQETWVMKKTGEQKYGAMKWSALRGISASPLAKHQGSRDPSQVVCGGRYYLLLSLSWVHSCHFQVWLFRLLFKEPSQALRPGYHQFLLCLAMITASGDSLKTEYLAEKRVKWSSTLSFRLMNADVLICSHHSLIQYLFWLNVLGMCLEGVELSL